MSDQIERDRKFIPPLGWPFKFRAVTITPAEKHRRVTLNRYPRQVIGFVVRLPDEESMSGRVSHKALSVMWAKPARWWSTNPAPAGTPPEASQ